MNRASTPRRSRLAETVDRVSLLPAVLASLGLVIALIAQNRLDQRPEKIWFDGAFLYLLAAVCWWYSLRPWRRSVAEVATVVPGPTLGTARLRSLAVGIGLVFLTAVVGHSLFEPEGGGFALLRYGGETGRQGNSFTGVGALLWFAGTGLYVWALAERRSLGGLWERLVGADGPRLCIGRGALAVLAVTLLGAYFRFYDLPYVPLEMTSDHTEKLLDVSDVLAGFRPVYMPLNGGREPIQFYWTALLVSLGLPLTFTTLKIGMGIVSTLTIPLCYGLGRRVAGRQVGLLAALILAMIPWHIQITRIGLRISLSPFFAALTLLLLYRALTTGARNDWLSLGASLGAGMYGYSGFRPMAFGVVFVVILKLALDARRARADAAPESGGGEGAVDDGDGAGAGQRAPVFTAALAEHMAAAAGLSVLVATPLARYAVDRPDLFWQRTLTRVTDAEVALGNPAWKQLLINWKQALLMFNWTTDSAWFQSPPGRPALETVGGALLVLGVVTALFRLRQGDWRHGALLVVVPTMLVATVMALAFPGEVPHLSRAAGALPAVVVLAALPLPVLAERWRRVLGSAGSLVYFALAVALFVLMGQNTWQRYFDEYRTNYNHSTHPTSEGAAVARGFLSLGGELDHVYLVGWPHGWDYRAVGMHLGDFSWNGLLWGSDPSGTDAVELAADHSSDPAAKLYLVGGDHASSNIDYLRSLYPNAVVAEHWSVVTERGFWSVFVPARQTEVDGE